jgi:predicted enzyme related to lactoylglutathione lyase
MELRNALNWFEIPATDLLRAKRFYETVLDTTLRTETMGATQLAVFDYVRPGVGGALVAGADYRPSAGGSIVYLGVRLIDAALERVGRAGGAVAQPRTALAPGMGFYAHVIDSEGNRVGLHAPG